jgi:DNA-binding LacI/PurR family transcriptional regulator
MVTQKDVARDAGVSVSTVSRVVRGANYIDAATRQRVLDAIEALHYQPDLVARRLKYGRTYTIGLIVNDISNPFFGHVVIGAQRTIGALSEPEFELLLFNTSRDPEKERRALDVVLNKRVEGIILASMAAPECIDAARHAAGVHHIPVVSIDNHLGDFEFGIVSADNQLGGRELARHLLQHGHRRIGIIAGPHAETHARERIEGCAQALAEYGLGMDEELVGVGNWSHEDGYRITQRWLEMADPPTAILSSNNFMCMGALYALRERNLRVPEDIAIVSFDSVEFGNLLRPCLTTLDYDWEKIGEDAARLVLEGIQANGENREPQQIREPVRLLIRESCGCECGPVW